MPNDLRDKLEDRLVLSEVVQALCPAGTQHERVGHGFKCCCPFHTEKTASFNYSDERGSFKCFGCGKGGDIFSFIAFAHRLDCSTDFPAVLEKACELAGLEYEREQGGDPKRLARKREIGDVLTAFHEVARKLMTQEQTARVRQHLPAKVYLTPDCIERWELGIAPSQNQCERAGISPEQLRLVGLLKTSQYEDREYMHFYNSMTIPHLKNGRCVYMADRALGARGKDGKKKILNMSLPDEDGFGGVAKPCAYNLAVMWSERARAVGVLLVEARLDAIACTERGHPAVSYLDTPSPAFVVELAKSAGAQLYYCPDGTADMTRFKRAQAAGLLGWDVKCCRLPDGQDPDDLSGEALAAVKCAAVECVEEWFGCLEACV